MDFMDLIGYTNEKELEKEARMLQVFGIETDLSNEVDRWLVSAYVYALNQGLKDYQARSFASEFTLLKTGSIKNCNVDMFYREDWLDSYLCDKYKEILADCGGEKDDLLWARVLGFMSAFYRSSQSWHYERVKHQVNVKLSKREYEMFMSVEGDKKIDKFHRLLTSFNKDNLADFERIGSADTQLTFKMGESAYDLFMSVPANSKSGRFFALLYSFFALNE
jgi:hypothetical protein